MASSTLAFLNANSGAIQAIATVILVLVTYWYVRLTRGLVRESSNSRLDTRLPIIEPSDLWGPVKNSSSKTGQYIEFKLNNIGYGPALYIRVISPDGVERRIENIPEGESGRWSMSITNDEISTFKALPKEKRVFYVKYSDIFGREIVSWVFFDATEHSNGAQQWVTFGINAWHLLLPNDQVDKGLMMPPGLTVDLLADQQKLDE